MLTKEDRQYFGEKSDGKIFALTIAVIYLIFSLLIYPQYTAGDQSFYRPFYDSVSEFGLLDGFLFYRASLGASEPIYFIVSKVCSGLIDKDLLMSLLNGVLVYLLVIWIEKNKISRLVIPLLALNFYLLVLLFSAERLKFAMLLLMLAVNSKGLKKSIFAAFSFLSHTQAIFLIVNWLSLQFIPILTDAIKGKVKKRSLGVFFLIVLFLILIIPLAAHMQEKLSAYSERSSGLGELIKPGLFVILTLFYANRDRFTSIVMHLPILMAAYLVGGERTVIFSYFIFLSFSLKYKKGINSGVFFTSLYFCFQGIIFLGNVIAFGDGFAGS